MATIKSYSDLKQSKKLAEILPLESADMYWSRCTITDFGDGALKVSYAVEPCNISQFRNTKEDIPCWSLASLLSVLPYIDFTTPQLVGTPKTLYRCMYNDDLKSHAYDNPIDACYEMIIKLHELNLL